MLLRGLQIFVENKSIHNHPLKKFEVEGQKVVAILIEASGTKQDELWRLQKVSMKRGGSWKGNSHAQQRKPSPRSPELVLGDYASA